MQERVLPEGALSPDVPIYIERVGALEAIRVNALSDPLAPGDRLALGRAVNGSSDAPLPTPASDLAAVLARREWTVHQRTTLQYLDNLGVTRLGHVLDTFPPILGLSLEANLKPTVAYLQSLGVTRLGHVLDTFPPILGLSLEANLKPTVVYLQSLGVTRLGHVLDTFPPILG